MINLFHSQDYYNKKVKLNCAFRYDFFTRNTNVTIDKIKYNTNAVSS